MDIKKKLQEYFKKTRMKILLFITLIFLTNALLISVFVIHSDIKKITHRAFKEILLINTSLKIFKKSEHHNIFKNLKVDHQILNICIYINKDLYQEYISKNSNKKCMSEDIYSNKIDLKKIYIQKFFHENNTSILIIRSLKNIYIEITWVFLITFLIIAFLNIVLYFAYFRLYNSTLHLLKIEIKNIELKSKNFEYDLKESDSIANMSMDLNQENNMFLRKISHEFRTPLHSINSFSIYGIKEIDTAEKSSLLKYFRKISSATSKLIYIIDNIFCLASLCNEKEIFLIKKNDIVKVLELSIEKQKSIFLNKNVSIDINKNDCNTEANFDSQKILQLFDNIINNSIKFSSEEVKISISFYDSYQESKDISLDPPSIYIEISDQGLGIPKNELSSVFEKFVQSSITKDNSGIGIGLFICKNIIKAHEGKIIAKSNKTNGTTIILSIPRNLREGKKTNLNI